MFNILCHAKLNGCNGFLETGDVAVDHGVLYLIDTNIHSGLNLYGDDLYQMINFQLVPTQS